MEKKVTTLCIVKGDGRILLGMKKRGFGEGRWNGFGGKLHENETIEQCAIREVKEEAGIDVVEMKKHGVILFKFEDNGLEGNPDMEVNIFSISKYKGEITESDEMRPRWFLHEEIPYDSMWPDDEYWLSMLLEGKNFVGEFNFSDTKTIKSHVLTEVEKIA